MKEALLEKDRKFNQLTQDKINLETSVIQLTQQASKEKEYVQLSDAAGDIGKHMIKPLSSLFSEDKKQPKESLQSGKTKHSDEIIDALSEGFERQMRDTKAKLNAQIDALKTENEKLTEERDALNEEL